MNATNSKPSRFWGATPSRIKWLVCILFLLLIGLLLVIGNFMVREIVWKGEATNFAAQAGVSDARMYYSHGSHRLLEIALIDESGKPDTGPTPRTYDMKPTGRQADGFDIYYLYQSRALGAPLRISQESYLKSFNHAMRTMCANPDWFGPHGERLGKNEGNTNRAPFKPVPE